MTLIAKYTLSYHPYKPIPNCVLSSLGAAVEALCAVGAEGYTIETTVEALCAVAAAGHKIETTVEALCAVAAAGCTVETSEHAHTHTSMAKQRYVYHTI
jgi:hypothetical protein